MGLHGKQIKDGSVADGKLVELYINSDGSRELSADWEIGSARQITKDGSNLINTVELNDAIASAGDASEWQDSAIAIELDSANIVGPSTGDRYLITGGTALNDFATHEEDIAEWDGSQWVFITPSTGTYISVDALTDRFFFFGGSTWGAKFHENTTASTGLTKVGNDVQVAPSLGGAGLTVPAGVMAIGDVNKGVQVNADDVQVDASEIAGDGLQQVSGGGNEHLLEIQEANTSVVADGSGLRSAVPVASNKDMAAATTTTDEDQATATALAATPAAGSYIQVCVNGLQVSVGDGVKTKDCYFSGDGGTTARAFSAIVAGDTLHWMGSNAGYELQSSPAALADFIDFNYVVA